MKNNMIFILASGSPRRRELLKLLGIEFSIFIPDADETPPSGFLPSKVVETLAKRKAQSVYETHKDCCIISADTIVTLNNTILGKPNGDAEAAAMLKMLSGQEHAVYTGVCIRYMDREICFSQSTKVQFYDLSEKEIAQYVKTGEPLDKAGAYGIQGKGCLFVRQIYGDYYNVVGLPIARLARELNKLNNTA